uniref:T-cell surface glycoprotein CD3 epsilon chain n=1 Tax=Pelusios castaneus TaxID=367368 RepID=A0A8C8S6C2_9SAUR
MKLELSLYVLGLLLCVAGTTAQEMINVAISGMKVTLSWPFPGNVEWKKGTEVLKKGSEYVIEEYNPNNDGSYACVVDDKTYRFHLGIHVCETCEEVDVLTVAGVIIADLLITLGVLVLVYYFSKNRKGRVGASTGGRPRAQKMARPPPVPNPDYEPIRKGQREVYAGLESRGF